MKTIENRLIDAVLAMEPTWIRDQYGNRTDWIECPMCTDTGRIAPDNEDPTLGDLIHDYDCPYRLARIAKRANSMQEEN